MHGQRDLLDWQDENKRGNVKERSPPKYESTEIEKDACGEWSGKEM